VPIGGKQLFANSNKAYWMSTHVLNPIIFSVPHQIDFPT